MGGIASKSPLERRNTVLRRSQRKSIHGTKSKVDKLAKDIRKFKGTEEDSSYVELKARVEAAERDLRKHAKDLQPQIRQVHAEASKRAEECHKLLSDKLEENRDKLKAALDKQEDKRKGEDDEVFVEEVDEEQPNPEEATERRKTVEMKVIQVESIEASPQINKRFSAMKIGIPVMPGSMIESLNRKTQECNQKNEEQIASIRKEIEKLEDEISQFVGRKNGRYYNKIRFQLESFSNELHTISTMDDDIQEQIKLCVNYINSCLSFLDEKAVDDDVSSDDECDEVVTGPMKTEEPHGNLSPRSIRTTYI